MIFITTGTQGPFDRLIKTMDEMSPSLNGPVIAQVATAKYVAKNIKVFEWLTPTEFSAYFNQARLIVSHAGMGNIISALVLEKPIIIIPRRVEYGEQRNDHQLATAKTFAALNYVHVVFDEHELKEKIQSVLDSNLEPLHRLGKYASPQLINSVRNFIQS